MNKRTPGQLLSVDLERYPVWEYDLDEEGGPEPLLFPVLDLPVFDLTNRVVASKLRLNNGDEQHGMISNLDLGRPELNEHFLLLSLLKDGRWFTMERYHDPKFSELGPAALASFLGLTLDEVFPIEYDVSRACKGAPESVRGHIDPIPKILHSTEELIRLALPKATL